MAANSIQDYLVGLGFEVDEGGLGRFEGALTKIALGAAAAGAAVVAAAGAIFAAVKGVAEDYDQLDKLATRFRTTAEAVDEFADIGKVLGLSEDQTIGGLKALDRAIGDTALGLGRAKKVFEEIGISVLDATGKMKPTTEVMDDLAAKLGTMEKGKAIAVMERLGLDPALMKIFNADLGQLRADLAEIDKAAGFDLTDAVAQSKVFVKSWKGMQLEWQKVQLVVGKLYESIAVKLMPQMAKAVDDMRRRIESARRFIMENMEGIRRVIAGTIEYILRVFGFFWAIFGRIIDVIVGYVKLIITAFNQLDPALQTTILVVAALIAAWKLLNLSFLLSPIGVIAALGIALLGLYDDYMTWKEGGESLIDWGEWEGPIKLASDAMESFGELLTLVFTQMFTVVDMFAKLLTGDFSGAWALASEAVDNAAGIFSGMINWIVALVDGIGELLGVGPILSDTFESIAGTGSTVRAIFDAIFGSVDLLASLLTGDFVGAWHAVGEVVDAVVAIFSNAWGMMRKLIDTAGELVGLGAGITGRISAAVTSVVPSAAGLGAPSAALGSSTPALGTTGESLGRAAPLGSAGAAGAGVTLNQKTEINVSGTSDPATTARMVAGEQDRTNANMTRNAGGAVR